MPREGRFHVYQGIYIYIYIYIYIIYIYNIYIYLAVINYGTYALCISDIIYIYIYYIRDAQGICTVVD